MFRYISLLLAVLVLATAKQPYNETIAAKMANISAAVYFATSSQPCPDCY
jgi:hypothetical protein